jgi:signal transduction histidine kinase
LPLVHREHLYQIAQEAVNNALKYSGASRIEAVVAVDGDAVSLTVTDNGAGFDPAAARAGLGLDSFRLRGAALGARLSIDSRIGRGTTISCVCPTNDAQIFAMTGS